MRKPRFHPIVWIAFALMTSACAGRPPVSPVAPPRLQLPTAAASPCRLPRLGPSATLADLELTYARRGEALVACDAARRLAVETLEAERALQDEWRVPN
jgi:hypothetical protein